MIVTDLTIEEGFKMIISSGIVSPEDLLRPGQNPQPEDAASRI